MKQIGVEADETLQQIAIRRRIGFFGHVMRSDGLEKRMLLACGEGRRRRRQPRRRWMDEIHEVSGMKLTELREMTTERKNGDGLPWWPSRIWFVLRQDEEVDKSNSWVEWWVTLSLLTDLWLSLYCSSSVWCALSNAETIYKFADTLQYKYHGLRTKYMNKWLTKYKL